MSSPEDRRRPVRPTLESRVASTSAFDYVPGRVLVRGAVAVRRLQSVLGGDVPAERLDDEDEELAWFMADGLQDPLAVVRLLRAEGFVAQPDHVLLAHCDPCCGPHPAATFEGLDGDPLKGNPLKGNPLKGNPLKGNPLKGNPLKGNPRTSGARPAPGRAFPVRGLDGPGRLPRVCVLDTGLAEGAHVPPLLGDPAVAQRVTGVTDVPDAALVAPGATVTWAPDGWLDPVAGHGTFIAGIVEQLAPGCAVRVERVLSPLGDARESDVRGALLAEAALPPDERPDLLSLSFGGPLSDGSPALRSAIARVQLAGIVVVASAGNDGTSIPQYPAAYEGVVAVGGLTPDGPAPWTNYGSWVDACAPGLDLVSAFFAGFDGPEPRINTEDADHFAGWARWTGTSFAAPVVVAALAREMVLGACSAADAVQRVVHAPEKLRLRCLGTVVTT